MATVDVRGTLGPNSQFAKAARKAAGEKLRYRIDLAAKEVGIKANELSAKEYQIRPAARRHILGQHFVGSFKCTPNGYTFPVTLTLKSRAANRKVAILMGGSAPHVIVKHGGGPKSGLVFPRTPVRGRYGGNFTPSPYAALQAKGGGPKRFKKVVFHPGTRPNDLMERAMIFGIRKSLNKSVADLTRSKARSRV